jgi:sterol desaturase/sphingolipid hydroxylase (fatty acid hydroxylase superfamily)
MIGLPLGLLAANATEWFVHKHVLHGRGKNKKSFFSFHWHEHHAHSRRHGHYDADYERSPFAYNAQGKEVFGIIGLGILVAPLAPVAPFFVASLYYAAYNYYRMHRRAHLDPEWARQHCRWHYDHHMGPDQHKNWCVTSPLFDHIMGTREFYLGTAREKQDRERAAGRRSVTTRTE